MYFVHVYIFFLKDTKKNFQKKKIFKISKSFPKKRKIFNQKEEKKSFELGALDFLVTFSKNAHFFSFKDFKIL